MNTLMGTYGTVQSNVGMAFVGTKRSCAFRAPLMQVALLVAFWLVVVGGMAVAG